MVAPNIESGLSPEKGGSGKGKGPQTSKAAPSIKMKIPMVMNIRIITSFDFEVLMVPLSMRAPSNVTEKTERKTEIIKGR